MTNAIDVTRAVMITGNRGVPSKVLQELKGTNTITGHHPFTGEATGLYLLPTPGTTAQQIADILRESGKFKHQPSRTSTEVFNGFKVIASGVGEIGVVLRIQASSRVRNILRISTNTICLSFRVERTEADVVAFIRDIL